METDIQKLLDAPDGTGKVTIPPGEYGGKFIIRKSCVVDGGGAVLWNSSGPVLVIDAENVTIRNLNIELTGDNIPYEQQVSVYCRYPDTKFYDTEINGMLLGIPDEEQYWGLPKTVSLGKLPAEKERSFSLELYAPAEAELSCNFHDIRLSQDMLTKGYNNVALTVDKIRSGSLIYGYIFVKSAVTRRIIVSGETTDEPETPSAGYMLCSVEREAPIRHGKMLEGFDPVQLASMPEPEKEEVEIPIEAIDEGGAHGDGYYEENVTLSSGKRIPLSMKMYRIELFCKKPARLSGRRKSPDIDGYMFMLGVNRLVGSDRRMIFFGNDRSECGSVRYLNSDKERAMLVDFRTVPKDVTRMILLFSIYGDDPSLLFSSLGNAEISVLCENGVHMHLPLEDGINCRTILALGFEKTDGVWEMITSGKGVGMSLEEICRSYGVNVVS